MLSYAFSFNDFWDKKRKAYFIFPLFLSFLLFSLFNTIQIVLASIFLLIVTLYSYKPLKLKAKPFFSSFCNGIGFSLLFLLGYSVRNLDQRSVIFFFFFFSLNMVAQFLHEFSDFEEDKKNRIITTAVFLGKRKIKKLCYFFLWLSFITCFYLFYLKIVNYIFLFTNIFFVIFFTHKLLKRRINRKLRKDYKILGIFAGFIYFILIILF